MSPMWLTSNTPTPVRTAMCSAIRPEYSTGMSHPPKSTIFAPISRWTLFKAVLRKAVFNSAVGLNGFSYCCARKVTPAASQATSESNMLIREGQRDGGSALGWFAFSYPVDSRHTYKDFKARGGLWRDFHE